MEICVMNNRLKIHSMGMATFKKCEVVYQLFQNLFMKQNKFNLIFKTAGSISKIARLSKEMILDGWLTLFRPVLKINARVRTTK